MLQDYFTGNKASGINKNFFWYFYWNYVFFFASSFKDTEILKSYCFERNSRIWYLNSYNLQFHQTTFHNTNNISSKDLFVVYKLPLRIEDMAIKLNEIKVFKVLFSKFCYLFREDLDKSRLTVVKIFYGHISTRLMVPIRCHVLLFRFPRGSIRAPIFHLF